MKDDSLPSKRMSCDGEENRRRYFAPHERFSERERERVNDKCNSYNLEHTIELCTYHHSLDSKLQKSAYERHRKNIGWKCIRLLTNLIKSYCF